MSKTTRQPLPAPPPVVEIEGGIRGATRRLLLDAAMLLIREGQVPTLPEVARRAQVSRATAYRYFPSRSALITAVIDVSLGPLRSFDSAEPDGRRRVAELFESTFPRFREFEPQMRAAAQLALEHWARERAGLLDEVPYRRGHRVAILAHALAPLQPVLPAAALERLHRALSVLYGIEPRVVLKDIWGLADAEVDAIVAWMADALVTTSLREAEAAPPARRTRTKAAS
ncbi:TetR family transcriptional regulator [Rubrivivax gelatinosus]|nr:TetR family transcriptional regulator [Rubrivivax gelatinosus]